MRQYDTHSRFARRKQGNVKFAKRCIFVAASAAICLAVASGTVAAAANCTLVKIADWPVQLDRNHLIIDGAINGQKIRAILDTGATRTLIFRGAAERLGLSRQQSRRVRMFGVGGETDVETALVEEFRLDQTVRKNWRVIVAGEHDFGADVLLGEDFFQHVDIEFDLAHNAVRLYEPRDCDGATLAYWANRDVGEVKIEAVNDARPQIVLTVQINGRPVEAELDSGAAITMLDKLEAARLGVTPEMPGVVAAGMNSGLGQKSVDAWIGKFQSFTIGNETIKDAEILFADWHRDLAYSATGSRIPEKLQELHSMLLGVDFLRAHRLLVAHSQRKIYFTYTGGPVFYRAPQPMPRNESHPEDSAKPKAGEN
jgi:predicted aspartyl protease